MIYVKMYKAQPSRRPGLVAVTLHLSRQPGHWPRHPPVLSERLREARDTWPVYTYAFPQTQMHACTCHRAHSRRWILCLCLCLGQCPHHCQTCPHGAQSSSAWRGGWEDPISSPLLPTQPSPRGSLLPGHPITGDSWFTQERHHPHSPGMGQGTGGSGTVPFEAEDEEEGPTHHGSGKYCLVHRGAQGSVPAFLRTPGHRAQVKHPALGELDPLTHSAGLSDLRAPVVSDPSVAGLWGCDASDPGTALPGFQAEKELQTCPLRPGHFKGLLGPQT